VKVDLDYKFGQILWLKNDPEQQEYLINRIILEKGRVVFELFTPLGEYVEVPEFMITKERDELKAAGVTRKDEDE
jgi:hypothetical protein